jgi:hypothetical protein
MVDERIATIMSAREHPRRTMKPPTEIPDGSAGALGKAASRS